MQKQKTHKGLKKRVKVSAKGKIKYKHSFGGHLMSKKNAKRRRKIASTSLVEGKMGKKIKEMLA
ncbi:MAG: 50S ribosomal protein L35 [Planctomycetota bacterium]|jgi:large subunit ribosomal protein L35